jgi:hypothetical protein
MPAMALSRVVESGAGGQDLPADAWQRLEALPAPRSRRDRIYPLVCLVAVAACAFTAAGNDRFTAVGQWIRRASQQDLARLRAPWDPLAGRYRVPDEDDPGRWTGWTSGPCLGRARTVAGAPAGRLRPACAAYRARRRARQREMLARDRLRAATSWSISRSTPNTTRPATSPTSWNGGPGGRGGDLRCPPCRARKPGLAGHGQESPLHRRREAQPAAAARVGQDPALVAGTGRPLRPREAGTAAPRPAP